MRDYQPRVYRVGKHYWQWAIAWPDENGVPALMETTTHKLYWTKHGATRASLRAWWRLILRVK